MTNEEDLCEDTDLNLKGTGQPPFEKATVDTYLKQNLLERRDYKVYNAELWNFLYQKYGGSEVKRIYEKHGGFYT